MPSPNTRSQPPIVSLGYMYSLIMMTKAYSVTKRTFRAKYIHYITVEKKAYLFTLKKQIRHIKIINKNIRHIKFDLMKTVRAYQCYLLKTKGIST